jgi:tetraacyldisaccharide 4'-kinase
MPEVAGLRRWLGHRWYGGAPPLALQPLAALYGLITRIRRTAYARGWCRSRHPGVPVIVVGNLTTGGTGKTPLVLWLVAELRHAGQRPGVVLRGYGGTVRDARLVSASDTAEQVGDEAALICQRMQVPVAVGADRAAAAALLARAGCTVIISDDGLQHLALRRDLTIVVVDGERGFGNGALLPAGPLREPAARLDSADLVVVNGADHHRVAARHDPLYLGLVPASLRNLRSGAEEAVDALRGASVHAVAGIGHPQRFFTLLRRLGAHPVEHTFGDHHRFVPGELAFDGGQRIVMTEKDAVRCRAFATEQMWCLPVSAELPAGGATRLLNAVLAKIPAGGSASA